jgi:hypothetical protein
MECTDPGKVALSAPITPRRNYARRHERWAAELPQDVDKLTPQGRATTARADVDIMAGALALSDTQSFDLRLALFERSMLRSARGTKRR